MLPLFVFVNFSLRNNRSTFKLYLNYIWCTQNEIRSISSSCLFTVNAFAGIAADTVDLSLLNSEQSKIVQFELNTFSEIANSKITAENKNKYEQNLQQIIYCGYDVFIGDQSQFARITESNERLIFNTPTLMANFATEPYQVQSP